MTDVTLYHDDGETRIEDPEFVDTLCNTNQVAIDGEIYEDVYQVVYIK